MRYVHYKVETVHHILLREKFILDAAFLSLSTVHNTPLLYCLFWKYSYESHVVLDIYIPTWGKNILPLDNGQHKIKCPISHEKSQGPVVLAWGYMWPPVVRSRLPGNLHDISYRGH